VRAFRNTLIILAIFLIIATILPFITLEEWFIRIFDFPRIQIFVLSLIVLIAIFFFIKKKDLIYKTIFPILILTITFQVYNILPYTPLVEITVPKSTSPKSNSSLSLLVANVYMHNNNYGELIDLVNEYKPDLLLTLETDIIWENKLKNLEKQYQYSIKIPKDNTYGMHLYSKLPLSDTEIKYWLDRDIPSIKTIVQLPSGEKVLLYGLHPKPPVPTEEEDSRMRDAGEKVLLYGLHPKPPVPTEEEDSRMRDAEIIIVANRVAKAKHPAIVAGDFNDVAWSSTTKLFQQVSGLSDPRIGRGMFNTYHAKNPLFRWPLDHVFHSGQFKIIAIERLPSIDSDHFPIYINLSYEPSIDNRPEKVNKETKKLETQTIEEGVKEAKESN